MGFGGEKGAAQNHCIPANCLICDFVLEYFLIGGKNTPFCKIKKNIICVEIYTCIYSSLRFCSKSLPISLKGASTPVPSFADVSKYGIPYSWANSLIVLNYVT